MALRSARNQKGVPVDSNPAVPIAAKGIVKSMTICGLNALNRATIINSMMAAVGIVPGMSAAWESTVSSYSPPHSVV